MPRKMPGTAYIEDALRRNPEFVDVYWFPAEGEYRLVYTDPTAVPSDPQGISSIRLTDEEDGKMVPLRIAIIRPEEVGVVPLPPSWAQTWDDARKLPLPRRAA